MSWYLRSMRDGDTHRGRYSVTTRIVVAECGVEFEPLRLTSGCPAVLPPGSPLDADVCLWCYGVKGHPLSALEALVEDFVTAVACSDCRVSAGSRCDGPVCGSRRSAALEHYIAEEVAS